MASIEKIQGSNIDPVIELPVVDNMSGTGRAKDGVPSWDGNPTSYQEYEESALLWEQSVAMQKRYLCGPRLAAELTGAAKRLVAGRHRPRVAVAQRWCPTPDRASQDSPGKAPALRTH